MLNKYKKGMTLPEMMIIIGVFSFIMFGVIIFFFKLWTQHERTLRVGISNINAHEGVRSAVNSIRNARTGGDGSYLIEAVDNYNSKFTFYSDIDGDTMTEKVCYSLDLNTDEFEKRVVEPNLGPPVTYGDCNTGTLTLVATNVNNHFFEPAFYYYDSNNNLLDTATLDVIDIKMVKISLVINSNPSISHSGVTIESSASIRNLNTSS